MPASRLTAMSISQFSMSVPRLKEVQMEVHDFELKKVPHFARKPVNINVLRSATPNLARVPANRYYFDVYYSYLNVCSELC